MRILAIDTTAVTASAAVSEDGRTVAEFFADAGRTHSEVILPMAEAALASASLALSDIDLFACSAGPGSFTGVRIGVATVKGLAFGQDKPCAAVSTLEAIAENLVPLDGIYCAVMDARRGQVYNALFRAEAGRLVRLTPDRAVTLTELAEELANTHKKEKIWLAGDGYAVAERALTEAGIANLAITPRALRFQSAAAVARCAFRLAGENALTTDEKLAPVYLRLPQAERDRAKQTKGAYHE